MVFDTLAPTDWVRKGLEALEPVEAGRFAVHGAHDAGRVRANRIGVKIEAALAFGTGHHGTTRGCLLALDRIAKKQTRRRSIGATGRRRRKSSVLDIGTGTGVLALAAAKALRRPVLASDIDARAVKIARENAQINGMASYVEVIHAAGLGARKFRQRAPFALIFANILLQPLQELATPMARLVAPNGEIVLSGLLSAQAARRARLISRARPRARTPHQAGRLDHAGACPPRQQTRAVAPSGPQLTHSPPRRPGLGTYRQAGILRPRTSIAGAPATP